MTNSSLVLTNTAQAGTSPLPAVLGAVIVVLLLLLSIQYIRAEKERQKTEALRKNTSDYTRQETINSGIHEGFIRPNGDGFIDPEKGGAVVGDNSGGNGKYNSWMVRTEFLSQQWSIQESDIDWVYEEDGQSTLGQGQKKKKVIGEGSFGKIYLGEYQGLKCAIKEVRGGGEREGWGGVGEERFLFVALGHEGLRLAFIPLVLCIYLDKS
jgi:hypothetical protein